MSIIVSVLLSLFRCSPEKAMSSEVSKNPFPTSPPNKYIVFIAIKSLVDPPVHQPGKHTLPANNSPTIVKKMDKTKST